MSKVDAQGRTVLEGDGTWPWLQPIVDDLDLIVRGVIATTFGGTDDPDDDGDTSSGFSTREHPEVPVCSLPQNNRGNATRGCPIPRLPWGITHAGTIIPAGTLVEVQSHQTAKAIRVPLADNGPSHYYKGKEIKHGIDLTKPTFTALGLDPDAGTAIVDYRIIGGAKYVK